MCPQEQLTKDEQARRGFFERGVRDLTVFPAEVYDSWARCIANHIAPDVPMREILTPEALQARRAHNAELLEVAVPFMEILYKVVEGSDFSIMLSDSEGYILKLIGDPHFLAEYSRKDNPLVEGSCRSESKFGTNGIGTPLAIRKPIQLTTNEHFRREPYPVTGTGAPIILPDGELAGALSMSGPPDKVHLHTLGMITAASRAIEEQLTLRKINTQLAATKNQLQTILDTFDQGVFLVDSAHTIIDTNLAAQKTLGFSEEEIINRPIHDFVGNMDFSSLNASIYDMEQPLRTRYRTENFFVTIHTVRQSTDNSFLFVFREAERVHNLVNKYIGSSAYFTFDDIIGRSPVITAAKENARAASTNSSNVLLIGESGTGKELFAQSIHNSSAFSGGPFIAVNCGAIPRSLIESELFGYEAGAFTGAKRAGSAGKFELANNGTIFLDEIGDMPYEVQIHLLRILQTKEVTRIGGTKPVPLNIRIIAATNVNLEQAIQDKTFRRDLYYRLNVLTFRIPPLRERGDDVLLLADYFIRKYQQPNKQPIAGVSAYVKQLFLQYHWPGNIRELENTIERACLLTKGAEITDEFLPFNLLKSTGVEAVQAPASLPQAAPAQVSPVDLAEKEVIQNFLLSCGGNVKEAASRLGISRRTLYRKLHKYQIDCDGIRKHKEGR